MSPADLLADRLLINGGQAVAVVISTVVIYLAFVLVLRVVGQRIVSGLAAFDLAAAMALGALVGRTILGNTPVLAAGLLGLATLAVLEGLLGQLRSTAVGARVITPPPVLLMADGRLLPQALRRTHVVEDEVVSALRSAGIRSFAEVAAVVLEPRGTLSVLRRGELLDRRMMGGVRGAEEMPDSLFGS